MSEKPILFSGPMVKAILEGRKTQTRRVAKDGRLSPKVTQIELLDFLGGGGKCEGTGSLNDGEGLRVSFVRDCERDNDDGRRYKYTGLLVQSEAAPEDGSEEIVCPYGVPGDRLWVREAWGTNPCYDYLKPSRLTPHSFDREIVYRATAPGSTPVQRWRPSIFMPRWASRITLEITSVRVERLQDISEEDAKAEGIGGRFHPKDSQCWTWKDYQRSAQFKEDIFHYGVLVTPQSTFEGLWDSINGEKHPWNSNPWIWVIAFTPLSARSK